MHMLKIRCSSLGKIMTDAKGIDPDLLTSELAAISRKTKKSEEEKALLEPLLEMSLSAGAKTYIEKLAEEYFYDYVEVITGKYMEKGLMVEDRSIELYNEVFFTNHVKNTVRLDNEWLTGECDIVVPKVKGVDIKSAWSLATFPKTAAQGKDVDYEWQCRGYMMLWDTPLWDIAYCLVDTPDELIKYEQEDLHFVEHHEETKRITIVHYERDFEKERMIKVKVEAARRYFDKFMAQMEAEHKHVPEPEQVPQPELQLAEAA